MPIFKSCGRFCRAAGISTSPLGFVASTLLLLFGAACESVSRPTVSNLEQEIIETVLASNDDSVRSNKRGLFQTTSTRLFFVGNMTYEMFAAELRKNARYRDETFRSALEDFIRVNSTETKLVFPEKLPDSIVLIPDKEIRELYDKSRTVRDAQVAIQARFHGIEGIFDVSRPGIDSKQSIALICVGYGSGPSSGRGRFYILKFDGSKWTVETDDFFGPSWMS